ncbi:MAG TPA: hypothetical protein VM163_05815 [bacterium]|nr:hypothetical protein [bacterium]
MIRRENIDNSFAEWMDKLELALASKDGKALCEATRMVWSIGSIKQAYFPGSIPAEVGKLVLTKFQLALACINDRLDEDPHPDGDRFYLLYRENVSERLANLEDLIPQWCPVELAAAEPPTEATAKTR